MKQSVRVFERWGQGSSAAGDAETSEYNSENAQVYENGTLGPRPGWKRIVDTAGTRVFNQETDSLRGIVWFQETDADEHMALAFYDTSGSAHKFDILNLATNTWVAGQTLSDQGGGGTSFYPPRFDDVAKTLMSNDGTILTIIGPHILIASASSIGTVAAITTADGDARVATRYRERTYYWAISGAPGRIYYSEAADFSTVGASSSFPINVDVDSYAGAPVGVWSVKNALLIAAKDNRWLVLTGTSPENGTLRELGIDVVPVHGSAAVVDNQVFFLNPSGLGLVVATPSFVEPDQLRYLSPLAYPGSTEQRPTNNFMPLTGVGDDVNGNLFLPGRNLADDDNIVAVERINGVFNLSRWVTDTAPQDIVFTRGRPGEMYAAADLGTSWHLYSRDHTLNRPANSGDTKSVSLKNEANTDGGSDVVVDLGEVVGDQGTIIRPIKVVLDLDYWKGGTYTTPELKVDATVLGTESTTPEHSMAQQNVPAVDIWADTSGNAPYRRRVPVALPNTPFGTRFRVRLTFDNLAIDTVQVYYETQQDPR